MPMRLCAPRFSDPLTSVRLTTYRCPLSNQIVKEPAPTPRAKRHTIYIEHHMCQTVPYLPRFCGEPQCGAIAEAKVGQRGPSLAGARDDAHCRTTVRLPNDSVELLSCQGPGRTTFDNGEILPRAVRRRLGFFRRSREDTQTAPRSGPDGQSSPIARTALADGRRS